MENETLDDIQELITLNKFYVYTGSLNLNLEKKKEYLI